ncbi:hypothetical protein [Staphylococcus devriesei]|uniref:hypothetical protein n=1 Tax=Staphylococcus devriesei TaxID=586733 RepID=UPI0015F8C070|nr:hypothetical protein [Staphylococcus devriesei]
MWKIKEFERSSTKVERDVNEFVKSNDIKNYEIVGYQVNWAETYDEHYSHILIKYWEEQ